jgi:hypothetical protein
MELRKAHQSFLRQNIKGLAAKCRNQGLYKTLFIWLVYFKLLYYLQTSKWITGRVQCGEQARFSLISSASKEISLGTFYILRLINLVA